MLLFRSTVDLGQLSSKPSYLAGMAQWLRLPARSGS